MPSQIEIESFKKSLICAALISGAIFLLGIVIGVLTKVSIKPAVIGWGMTLGTPIIIGFYAGLFAWIGRLDPQDPMQDRKPIGFKKLFKWSVFAFFAIILLLTGYFIIDMVLRGSPLAEILFAGTLSGLYCSTMIVLVFFVPAFCIAILTLFAGKYLRKWLIMRHHKKQIAAMIFLPLLLPFGLDALEAKLGTREELGTESILTQREMATGILSAWHQLQYYEDSGTEAPLLFTLGFPKPIRTEGSIKKAGDITRCVYDKGYLIKETTLAQFGDQRARLEFVVLEQQNIEDRAVKLTSGSFDLKMIDEHKMSIELRTNYEPLMTPRWMWRPLEKLTASALHNHVIDQIEAQALEAPSLRLTSGE